MVEENKNNQEENNKSLGDTDIVSDYGANYDDKDEFENELQELERKAQQEQQRKSYIMKHYRTPSCIFRYKRIVEHVEHMESFK